MKPSKSNSQFFFVCLCYCLFIIPVNLFSQEYYITESYLIKDICSCDIDLDGDTDLIAVSSSNGLPDSLFIFYNNGGGILGKTSINRRNGIFVLCNDLDDDEYPDIVTKDASDILFIKNNGDGTFGEEVAIAPTKGNKVIAYISDMDGDNLNDLVYTYNAYYCKWGILKNEGELNFTDYIIYDDGLGGNLTPSIGMLNNDNLPDVSLAFNSAGTHFLINNGNFVFDTTLICSTITTSQICNLNLSPPEDLALFSVNTGRLFLYENIGNTEFTIRDTLPLTGPIMPSDLVDYNNDGYDDYCYAVCWWTGCTDSIYISLNNQNWSFLEPQTYYVGPMELFETVTADLNGDSFNDIIMYGYSPRNSFKILWNDGFGNFSYENPVKVNENFYQDHVFNIDIRPNPFTNIIHILINSPINYKILISIVDLFGRPVKVFDAEIIKNNEPLEIIWDGLDFSGKDIKQGIYFLMISDYQNNIQTIKIIKH